MPSASANFIYTEIETSINKAQYREVDFGSALNTESGIARSLSLKLGYQTRLWGITTNLESQSGILDYSGKTQVGIQKQTRSGINRYKQAVLVNRLIYSSDFDWYLSVGLANIKIKRDIKSIQGVSGLYEVYNFKTFQLGTSIEYEFKPEYKLNIGLILESALDGRMSVSFKNQQFDDASINLSTFNAVNIDAALTHQYSKKISLIIGIRHKQEMLGKSEDANLYRLKQPAGSFYQPKRDYAEHSIYISMRYSFK